MTLPPIDPPSDEELRLLGNENEKASLAEILELVERLRVRMTGTEQERFDKWFHPWLATNYGKQEGEVMIQESQGGQMSLHIRTLTGPMAIHDGVAGPEFVVAGSTVRIPANAVADVIEWLWKWERKYLEERG